MKRVVAATGRRTSVLLVDDSADFRKVARIGLELAGDFTVVAEAEDGVAAIRAARVHAPDLVLMDMNMPRLDGVEALLELRRAHVVCPVVMLTAVETGSRLDAALDAGALGVIRKGSSMASVIGQLRGLLDPAGTHQIVVENLIRSGG
jgi:DNA-binding NarL/FixJ family response regulator